MGDDEGTTEDGLEKVELNMITWYIRPYYTNLVYIGGGAFGNVCQADDERFTDPDTGEPRKVAIKKLCRPFHSGEIARRVFREIRLLRYLEHDNVLELVDVYTPDKNSQSIENIYLVTEHAGWDLASIIARPSSKLTFDQKVSIIYQLLRGLKYLHSGDIIHRDLKPHNLAVSPYLDLRILDFGLARKVSFEIIMTEYVETRYYRAPEILCTGKYNQKADMWSVGCILAELLTGTVLFKGSSTPHQLALIIKVCGSPDTELLDKFETDSSPTVRGMIEKLGFFERQSFMDMFQEVSPPAVAVDFLEKVLVLDPEKRMSVDDALEHAFVAELHDVEDEPVMENSIEMEDDELSLHNLTGWKGKVWLEIKRCQEHLRKKAELKLASEDVE